MGRPKLDELSGSVTCVMQGLVKIFVIEWSYQALFPAALLDMSADWSFAAGKCKAS